MFGSYYTRENRNSADTKYLHIHFTFRLAFVALLEARPSMKEYIPKLRLSINLGKFFSS